MNTIVFGKYLPYDSIIHKLDPRAKILCMMLMLVCIFIPSGWYGYLFLALVITLVIKLSKVPPKIIIKTFKPMLFMLFFLLVINVLTNKKGDVWLAIGTFTICSAAIIDTLYIAVRLILMIMITTTLTATTKPLELTLGLEYLLRPFGKIGLPYHEISMMISIALRFIPTIIEEAMRIMNAQKSRGVDFDEGKMREKIGAILSLIVPLFSTAFIRADDLALAMEARGYVPGAKRTRYKILKYETRDYMLFVCSILCVAINTAIAILVK